MPRRGSGSVSTAPVLLSSSQRNFLRRHWSGLVLTLGDVLFDTGKSELKADVYSVIEKLATLHKEYPTRKTQIEGFTDSVGSDENGILSERTR